MKKLYKYVKYGVNIYELKQGYDEDYILQNIDYALSHRDIDDMVTGYLEGEPTGAILMVHECPKCHELYAGYPAISRSDNFTKICTDCGIAEAIMEVSRK